MVEVRHPMLQVDDAWCAGTPIESGAGACRQVLERCFDLRPPRLIGAELEWLTRTADGTRPGVDVLASALGHHAPRTVAPSSPQDPLPHGGVVSVEPGGQVEISSAPLPSRAGLCAALAADADVLQRLLESGGVRMAPGSVDTERAPQRILPVARYAAMQRRFDRRGPLGGAMMCSTAAVHISIDCGADRTEAGQRWRMLNAVGPALVAAFADSPTPPAIAGSGGREQWASQRMRTWLALDPGRTGFDGADPGGAQDPIAAYADWALGAPMLCVRRAHEDWSLPGDVSFREWIAGSPAAPDRAPTIEDLDYHLSTLFPPVRPCGHLEVRYLDAQPGRGWEVPVAALDALSRTREAVRRATAIAEPTAGAWMRASREGLTHAPLRRAASRLLRLAAEADAVGADTAGASAAGGGAAQDGAAVDALADAARRCESGARPGSLWAGQVR